MESCSYVTGQAKLFLRTGEALSSTKSAQLFCIEPGKARGLSDLS